MFCVLSYDVCDDRRRGKISKLIERYGDRVQKSVFECSLEPERLKRLTDKASGLLDKKTDSLRLYMLCENCRPKIRFWGCGEAPAEDGAIVV